MAKIMIVDDSMLSRKNLREILTQQGHEIVGEAEDGQSALVKYGELKPDLVTLDITMPNMNGIDTLRELMSTDSNARVVMITSLAQKSKILEALQLGAKNYIAKPFEAHNIIGLVEDALK